MKVEKIKRFVKEHKGEIIGCTCAALASAGIVFIGLAVAGKKGLTARMYQFGDTMVERLMLMSDDATTAFTAFATDETATLENVVPALIETKGDVLANLRPTGVVFFMKEK